MSRIEAVGFRGDVEAAWVGWADRRRAALVGPHGSGKTTLLETLADRAEREGWRPVWLRASRGSPQPSLAPLDQLGPDAALLVDGAEALDPVRRWRVRRALPRAGLALLTLHAPVRWLPTLREHTTSPELLGAIIEELAGEEGLALAADHHALWSRHHGNLRAVLRLLYDRWAAAHRAGDLTAS